MAKVIYRDLDGHSPRVRWHGVTFLDGQPVEVENPVLLAKAKSNRFFELQAMKPAQKSENPAPPAVPPAGEPNQTQEGADEPNQDGTGEAGAQPPRKGPGRPRTRA